MDYRRVYLFECIKCKKTRQSVDKYKAQAGVCMKCKRMPKIPPGQIDFEGNVY